MHANSPCKRVLTTSRGCKLRTEARPAESPATACVLHCNRVFCDFLRLRARKASKPGMTALTDCFHLAPCRSAERHGSRACCNRIHLGSDCVICMYVCLPRGRQIGSKPAEEHRQIETVRGRVGRSIRGGSAAATFTRSGSRSKTSLHTVSRSDDS